MATQKYENTLLQTALEDLWSSTNSKKNFFWIILKKMQEWGYLGITCVYKWFKILLHCEFSEKSLTLGIP